MLIVYILRWLLLAMELLVAAPILYLCVISVSAIVTAKKRQKKNARLSFVAEPASCTFAVLIPAHNEEVILGTLLESLSMLDYPKGQYTVCVVADNCTDGTAELARAAGWVRVYERFDKLQRGKGYALNWLLHKLEEDQLIYDAYIILDADSVVVPTFLQSMAGELIKGARALQACNTVLNISDSPSTALRLIAMTLMNHVRPLGRNGLGASSTLTGNGMCLSRALLVRYPWQAFALSEDYQYYLTLVEHGERVRYVPEAVVRSQMPTTFAQMRTQDIRWESPEGNQTTWQAAALLLRAGIRYRDFARIEAIAELITPPLSLLTSWCLLLLLASLLLWAWFELIVGISLIAGLIGYIGTALYLARTPPAVYMALLHSPGFVLWKLWVYFVIRRSKKHKGEWVRTSRTVS